MAAVRSGPLRRKPPNMAEVHVSRTHRRPLRTTTGFEDREDHRSLSTSLIRTSAASSIGHVLLSMLSEDGGPIGWFDRSQADADGEGRWMCQQACAWPARRSVVQTSKAERSQRPGGIRYLRRCRHLPYFAEPCPGPDRRFLHASG